MYAATAEPPPAIPAFWVRGPVLAAPRPAAPAAPRTVALSDVFRLVQTAPQQSAASAKQTDALRDVLRGLRPAEQD